jgi:hypothetical protein
MAAEDVMERSAGAARRGDFEKKTPSTFEVCVTPLARPERPNIRVHMT